MAIEESTTREDVNEVEELRREMKTLQQDLKGALSALKSTRSEVDELRDELMEERRRRHKAEQRIDVLEAKVDPDPHTKEYSDLSKPEKVRMLREELVKRASSTQSGKAQMDYKDVQYHFDSQPSPGHCYDLMELVENEDGFRYADPTDGKKCIRVDSDAVKDESLFHGANKDEEGVPA